VSSERGRGWWEGGIRGVGEGGGGGDEVGRVGEG